MTQLPSVSELMINTAKSENSPPSTSADPPSKVKSTSPRSPSTIPRIASASSFSSKYNYASSRSGSTVLPAPPLRRLTEPSIMYNQGHSAPLQPHQLPQPPQPQPHSVPAHIGPPKGGALSAPGQLHQGSDYFNNSHYPSQIPGNYQLNQRVSISSSIDPLSREPSSNQIPLSSPALNKQSHPVNAVASHANLPPIPQYPQHPSQSQGTSPISGNPPYLYPNNIQYTPSQPLHHEMNPPPPGIPYYYPVAPLYQQGGQGPQGPQGPPGSQGPPGHQNPLQNPHQGHQEMYGPQGHPQPYMYQMGNPGGQMPPQQAIPNPGGSQPLPGYYHPGIPHHFPGMENGMPMMGVGMPMASGIYEENNALINKRRIIKRRTRTGCLTCRKRRIKCDERKPTCFNCERSKKVCLGYEKLNGLGNKKRRDTNLDLHPEYDDENEHDQDHDPEQDQDNEQDDDEGLLPQNEQTKEQQNGTGDHSGSSSHYPLNTNETSPGESKISVYNLIK